MTQYLAAIEVDRRQQVIAATDKLKEILGGSWNIEETVKLIVEIGAGALHTRLLQPVSGAVWLTSTDLTELRRIVWQFREELVDSLELPCTFAILEYTDLDAGVREMNSRIESLKNSKDQGDGRPSAPLFASCLIQPDRPANFWKPEHEQSTDGQHARRALVSSSSDQRFKQGQQTLNRYLNKFAEYRSGRFEQPWQFHDLAAGENDRYLALIRADGDGTSQLVSDISWKTLAEKLRWDDSSWKKTCEDSGWPKGPTPALTTPEQAMTRFGWALEDCIWSALRTAATQVLPNAAAEKFPIVPIVRAGEDTAMLCTREIAMELAIAFGQHYRDETKRNPVLQAARQSARMTESEGLSMSMGVLFAREKFPFEIMWDLAGELQTNAKRARREADPDLSTGWIDYFWLQSSGREGIDDARRDTFAYLDPNDGPEFRLYSRPWTLDEAAAIRSIAARVGNIPTRKWVQLSTLLRFGGDLAELAYRRWLSLLNSAGRDALIGALKDLKKDLKSSHLRIAPDDPCQSPWTQPLSVNGNLHYATCLFEIAESIKSEDLE